MHGRCWTADRRFIHGLQESNLCIFYDQEPETMDHILVGRCFSRQVWQLTMQRLHLHLP